jgi:DNA-binding GntR family transcriptional regulator
MGLFQFMSLSDLRAPARKTGVKLPPTRSFACADEIRKRILDGRYPGGMQLRQESLAEDFGVSRIPVREALVLLEGEGLLKIHPHRGAIVVEVAAADVAESFELRALIEPRLLEKSAPHLTPADYSMLRQMLDEYREQLSRLNVVRWGELNTQLHELLNSHANSPRMEAVAHQLLLGSDRFTKMHLVDDGSRSRAEKEHEMIVDLCETGQFSRACEVMRKHIVDAGNDLIRHLTGLKPAA